MPPELRHAAQAIERSGPTHMLQNDGLGSEIFIVDDDALVREALSLVFVSAGYRVMAFAEGGACVAAARMRTPACILIDMYMPGRSGLDILKQLDAANYPAPILIVSGRGDVPTAVQAIKHGARDFIEKCTNAGSIVARVGQAIGAWANRHRQDEAYEIRWRPFPGRDRLTGREIEVLVQIIAGAANKVAAKTLGISPRTIEVHRSRIMKKLGAKNAADLVRRVLSGDENMVQDTGAFVARNIAPPDYQSLADGRAHA
jgi:FixJ family two-component response regulator